MSLNVKLIVIGVVIVVLLVAFGRNPIQNRRDAKEEEMQGKDALVESIKEHNSKQRHPRVGDGMFSGRSNITRNRGGAPARTSDQYPTYLLKPGTQTAAPLGQNPYARPQTGGGAAPGTQQGSGYYPPPPVPAANGKPGYPSQTYTPGPGSGLDMRLRSGQPVAFSGERVFTYDAGGNQIPMPDGVYKMADGQINLIVRDGRKIVITH